MTFLVVRNRKTVPSEQSPLPDFLETLQYVYGKIIEILTQHYHFFIKKILMLYLSRRLLR